MVENIMKEQIGLIDAFFENEPQSVVLVTGDQKTAS